MTQFCVKDRERNDEYYEMIIMGYLNKYCNVSSPYVIILLITKFYEKSFNIYGHNGHRYIKNCHRISMNGYYACFTDEYNNIYQKYYASKEIDPLPIVFDMNIDLLSNGLTNSDYFMYNYNDNILYKCGYDYSNKIGKDLYEIGNDLYDANSVHTIIHHNFKSPLMDIKCGEYFALFLTINGNVFGCGNNDWGQLNRYNKKIPSNVSRDNNIVNIMDRNNITSINCCKNTSYMLNNNNILMSCGDNDNGLLGSNYYKYSYSPELQYVLDGTRIKSFDCGIEHIGCISSDNELYMFGHNKWGQCSYKNSNHLYINIKIDNIVSIKCGSYHNIIKTNNNEYYSFGKNDEQQLLLNINDHRIYIPTLISVHFIYNLIGNQSKIIDIIPGNDESFILQ